MTIILNVKKGEERGKGSGKCKKECTRKVVGSGFFDSALPEPPAVTGPHPVIGLVYITGLPLQVWLSDHHTQPSYRTISYPSSIEGYRTILHHLVIGLCLHDMQGDLSDQEDSFALFLILWRMYSTMYMDTGHQTGKGETMLFDQTIQNATNNLQNAAICVVIGIACVIGIAVFNGVSQVLSGPCTKRHIGR